MKNVAKEILGRIETMKNEKQRELAVIYDKAKEAGENVEAADKAMKEAYERLDLAAYEKARNAKAAAEVAAEMYGKRYAQIEKKEFISEEESDAVIASLKQYEDDLAAEYESAIVAPISSLNKTQIAYVEAVQEAERTLREWTASIHPNYRSAGTIYPDGTNRSPVPIPVRSTPYKGSMLSQEIGHFLEEVQKKH